MNKNIPLVSIVITSYNREKWIGQAIQSALDQDYENIEVIISDNCSTDNSDNIIRSFCTNDKVRYSKNETNIGMIPNFNKAFFELAKGDYIINISSDDYLLDKTFISKAINIIQSNNDVLIVFGKYQSHFEYNNKILESACPQYYQVPFKKGTEVFLDFAKFPYFGWAACLLDRNFLVEHKMIIPDVVTIDIYMNLEIMLQGNVGFVDTNAYMIRYHEENATKSRRTATELINDRLVYIERLYQMAKINKDIDKDKIEQWRYIMVRADIKTNLISFILSGNQIEYDIFKSYVIEKYSSIYDDVIQRDKKYWVVKKIIIPVCKNKRLQKIANSIFPTKLFFSTPYNKNFKL